MNQQSDRPTPSSQAQRAAAAIEKDDELRAPLRESFLKAAKEINATNPPPPPPRNEPESHFVSLTNRLTEAMLEAAHKQVTRAENLYHQVELECEDLRQRAKARWEEIQKLERDLEDYSTEFLQTSAKFNGKVDKK
jgi:hypothetical protein